MYIYIRQINVFLIFFHKSPKEQKQQQQQKLFLKKNILKPRQKSSQIYLFTKMIQQTVMASLADFSFSISSLTHSLSLFLSQPLSLSLSVSFSDSLALPCSLHTVQTCSNIELYSSLRF